MSKIIMSKAVAVPYLIAIILAVIVLGVIGYWFLTSSAKGTGVTSEAFCRGRLLQYCSDLRMSKIPPDTDFYSEKYAKDCAVYKGKTGWPAKSPNNDECKTILGI